MVTLDPVADDPDPPVTNTSPAAPETLSEERILTDPLDSTDSPLSILTEPLDTSLPPEVNSTTPLVPADDTPLTSSKDPPEPEVPDPPNTDTLPPTKDAPAETYTSPATDPPLPD